MVEHEIGLTVELVFTDVAVDRPVFVGVGGQVVAGPTHRGLALEVHVRPHRFEALVDAHGEVGDGQVIDVLDRINAATVKVEGFHPPQHVLNHRLGGVALLPIHVRHVVTEEALEPVLGPVAIRFAADATGVEPLGMVVVVGVVLVHVVDHKVAKHADACGVRSVHQRLELLWCAQAWVHTAWLHRPIPVEGGDLVHAVGRQARAVCGGVEGRQPKRVHAKIGEGPRFDVSGYACEVTAHPISPLGRVGQRRRIVAGVAVDEAVGHQHVDQRVVPHEVGTCPAPEGQQKVLGHHTVIGASFEVQRVLPIGQAGKVERPRPRGRVPCRSGKGSRRARWARARGAGMPQHGQHVIFDGGAEHWKRGVGHAGHGVLRHPTISSVGVGLVHGPDVVNDELVAVHPRRQGHVHRPLVGGGFDERCAGRPSVPFAVDADVARVAAPFEHVSLCTLAHGGGGVGLNALQHRRGRSERENQQHKHGHGRAVHSSSPPNRLLAVLTMSSK